MDGNFLQKYPGASKPNFWGKISSKKRVVVNINGLLILAKTLFQQIAKRNVCV